jgi:UDP-N-acetyl-D-mannosaminuronate dehydrogenase
MPDYVLRRLMVSLSRRGKPVTGSNLVLLGIAYKPNTSDVRESPALQLAEQLLRLGADISYIDDHAAELEHIQGQLERPFHRVTLSGDVLSRADAVVLVTDHDDVDYGLVQRASRYVLDTRHRCIGSYVEYL